MPTESNVPRVRKQVYHLTSEDLQQHPLCEFCSDEEGVEGQDEATVKPSVHSEVPGVSPGAYILAASFHFADGSKHLGYMYSGEPNDLGCISPVVLTGVGQVGFWQGYQQKELSPLYRDLRRIAEEVFPILISGRVKENGSLIKVTIPGFGRLSKNREIAFIR